MITHHINYIWTGKNDSNALKSLLSMRKALKKNYDNEKKSNVVFSLNFYCTEDARPFFIHELNRIIPSMTFNYHGYIKIEIDSFENLLRNTAWHSTSITKIIRYNMFNYSYDFVLVSNAVEYIYNTFAISDNPRIKVFIKEIFSLYILYLKGGYFFDNNILISEDFSAFKMQENFRNFLDSFERLKNFQPVPWCKNPMSKDLHYLAYYSISQQNFYNFTKQGFTNKIHDHTLRTNFSQCLDHQSREISHANYYGILRASFDEKSLCAVAIEDAYNANTLNDNTPCFRGYAKYVDIFAMRAPRYVPQILDCLKHTIRFFNIDICLLKMIPSTLSIQSLKQNSNQYELYKKIFNIFEISLRVSSVTGVSICSTSISTLGAVFRTSPIQTKNMIDDFAVMESENGFLIYNGLLIKKGLTSHRVSETGNLSTYESAIRCAQKYNPINI